MRVVQRLNSKIRPTTKKKEGGGIGISEAASFKT